MTTKSKGGYSIKRGDERLVHDIVKEHERLGELIARLGVRPPEPTAREEFELAEGSVPARGDLDDPRLKGRRELVRKYEGRVVRVRITREGFLYAGKLWGSLSAISKHVSGGTRRNGYEFFGLWGGGR